MPGWRDDHEGGAAEALLPLLPPEDVGAASPTSGEAAPPSRRPHAGALLPPRAAEQARQARRAKRAAARAPNRQQGVDGGNEGPPAALDALDAFLSAEQLRALRAAPTPTPPPTPPPSLRRWLYHAMNGNSTSAAATAFKVALTVVIVFNVVTYMLSTMPSLAARYQRFFDAEEAAVSSLFLVEYLVRLWTCVESHKYAGWRGRLKYSLRYSSICDALATFPFFLETAAGLILPSAKLPNTTFVRMFSIFRVLKTER